MTHAIGLPLLQPHRLLTLATTPAPPSPATDLPTDPAAVQDSVGPSVPTAAPPPTPGSEPPPLQPGEVSAQERPSNPQPDKVVFLPTETTTITRTYDVPVLDATVLGRIPSDYYQPSYMGPWPGFGGSIYHPIGGTFGMGQVDVVRDVPEYNADGTPRMQARTETLTESTYSQKNRTIGFGVAAAIAGAGTAALVGALKGASAGPAGMLVGGLLGGAAGAAIGYKSAVGDKVFEQWMSDSIVHPRLIGFNQWMSADYRTVYDREVVHNSDGTTSYREVPRQVLEGWWVRHEPELRWKNVGSYTYPTLQHTAQVGPVGGTMLAIGAGAVVGAGAGLAVGALL